VLERFKEDPRFGRLGERASLLSPKALLFVGFHRSAQLIPLLSDEPPALLIAEVKIRHGCAFTPSRLAAQCSRDVAGALRMTAKNRLSYQAFGTKFEEELFTTQETH
jgi:hypothetical protein